MGSKMRSGLGVIARSRWEAEHLTHPALSPTETLRDRAPLPRGDFWDSAFAILVVEFLSKQVFGFNPYVDPLLGGA
jgi:hypothetical protein